MKKGKKRAVHASDEEEEAASKAAKPKSKLSQTITAEDVAMDEQQGGPSANGGGEGEVTVCLKQ